MKPAGIMPMKPYCRKCGATVRWLRRCPRCGQRQWHLLLPAWMRR